MAETKPFFFSLRFASMPVSSADIAKKTAQDPVQSKVLELVLTGWPVSITNEAYKPFFQKSNELSIHQGCLMYEICVIVPIKLQQLILDELHDGHLGVENQISSTQLRLVADSLQRHRTSSR